MARSLQTLFGVGTLSGLTDGQLLERFARGRGDAAESEAAFTALVQRHGPMVLGICRAVLGDWHDAEDACQAAFLVLAQRAGLIRREDAVASWLYGVARRVALRARRQAARRRELERRWLARAGTEEPAAPPPAEPWPELYEELDRLPAPFRAAVVLCDLEGHSYQQAAGILHCPVGTVQSRLARGRERLRHRLERRGFAPATAWVGAAARRSATSATVALSPRLATAIARAAVGIVRGQSLAGATSATVAVLAGSEIRRQIMTRVLTALTTLVLTGLMATATIGLAIAERSDDPEPQPQPQADAAPQKDNAGPIYFYVVDLNGQGRGGPPATGPIHARVVDREGHGVPGLPVEVHRPGERLRGEPHRIFSTDDEGRVALPRDIIDQEKSAILIARQDRESLAWAELDPDESNKPGRVAPKPIVLTLMPLDHHVEGSVVDRAGRPAAGVGIAAFVWLFEEYPLLEPSVTDAAGRFVMDLPQAESLVLRVLPHPRYFGGIVVKPGDRTIRRVILEPAGGITGRLIDAATGKPVAGAEVGAGLMEGCPHRGDRQNTHCNGGAAITDDQGRFAITGLEPGVYVLQLAKAPGRPRATARAVEGLRVRAGADTHADLTLIEGRPLRGVVLDQETGRPAAGVLLNCWVSGVDLKQVRIDSLGRFTFFVPPGGYYLEQVEGPPNRLSTRYVTVPEQGKIDLVRLWRISREYGGFGFEKMKEAVSPPGERALPRDAAAAKTGVPQPPLRPAQRKVQDVGKAQAQPETPAVAVRIVTGRVLDPQGRPLAGIYLLTNDLQNPRHRINLGATDLEGRFVTWEKLPRRPIAITLMHAWGFADQTETLAPDRDQVEFTFRLEPASWTKYQPGAPQSEPIPPALRERLTFVDLDPRGTGFLAVGPGSRANALNRLPRGVRRLGDTFFLIGEKMIHVQGQMIPIQGLLQSYLPLAVKGIEVQARGQVLHFLHAAGWTTAPGTAIGTYVIHYADGSTEPIPIIYGRSLAIWWSFPGRKDEPTEARIAWTGSNDETDPHPGHAIRLFAMTWTNPHPEKEIATLDVLSAGRDCDPFLVALTLERDR